MTDARLRIAAVDLGAETGRVLVGGFDGTRLTIDEAHRFPNVPVSLGGTLYWDFLRLFGDVVQGLRRAGAAGPVDSVGVDTWGVDFGLLDARGNLVANPVHYRDPRTDGIEEGALAVVPRSEIYGVTGIQFMRINTLYQLMALARADDPSLRAAQRLLLVPDLFGYFLSGAAVGEYTNASTTQCLDARSRDWARPMLQRLAIPTDLLPEIVDAGTVLGGLRPEFADAPGLAGTRVIAPATHDTASAVVGTPLLTPDAAFLSSGTWSLIGVEIAAPVLSERALAANLTNEGGAAGTIRLLKNVAGLWLLQESRRAIWPRGDAPSYDALAGLAEAAPAFTAFIDPDDDRFSRPGDLPSRIRAYCAETGQVVPTETGTLVRVILESLALRYAEAIDQIASASGRAIGRLHVVGGGANNRLLCHLTACATGLPVTAGPVEATAAGNLAVQAIVAGELASISEARQLVAQSFRLTHYEPSGDWAEARARFAALAHRAPTSPPEP